MIPKVSGSKSVTYLNRTSISESRVDRFGSKDGYQEDMCLKEIGLSSRNLFIILGSVVNIIWDTYMFIQEGKRSLTVILNKIYSCELQKLRG